MFHADGTMTIGFTYPNMYLSEDYNSPQSPYWCLKAFVVLALPETDEFWAVEEEDYPSACLAGGQSTLETTVIWPPRQIVINHPLHHYLLSSGQSTTKTFKSRDAKYGKFAYSSAFGFSVPSGPLLHQTAPDSTLALRYSWDDTWRTRSSPVDVGLEKISTGDGKQITGLTSTWKPHSHLRNLEITTTLIPPLDSLPGWHVRIHRVSGASAGDDVQGLSLADGGFAIASSARNGQFLPDLPESELGRDGCVSSADNGRGALVSSWAGASGVVDLTTGLAVPVQGCCPSNSAASVMRADPNTNLISSRTMIPFVQHDIELSGDTRGRVFATAVFAVTASEGLGRDKVRELWRRRPEVILNGEGKPEVTVVRR